jgi:hypothetical protein
MQRAWLEDKVRWETQLRELDSMLHNTTAGSDTLRNNSINSSPQVPHHSIQSNHHQQLIPQSNVSSLSQPLYMPPSSSSSLPPSVPASVRAEFIQAQLRATIPPPSSIPPGSNVPVVAQRAQSALRQGSLPGGFPTGSAAEYHQRDDDNDNDDGYSNMSSTPSSSRDDRRISSTPYTSESRKASTALTHQPHASSPFILPVTSIPSERHYQATIQKLEHVSHLIVSSFNFELIMRRVVVVLLSGFKRSIGFISKRAHQTKKKS